MTDGLENTPPMVAGVEPALAGTRLNVVGFGFCQAWKSLLSAGAYAIIPDPKRCTK